MKNVLSGYKTKIAGWVMALAPLAAMIGYQYDPADVIKWLDEYQSVIVSAYALGGVAVHWFRNLAEK